VGVRNLDDALRAIGLAGGNVERFFDDDGALAGDSEADAEGDDADALSDEDDSDVSSVDDGESGTRGLRVEG